MPAINNPTRITTTMITMMAGSMADQCTGPATVNRRWLDGPPVRGRSPRTDRPARSWRTDPHAASRRRGGDRRSVRSWTIVRNASARAAGSPGSTRIESTPSVATFRYPSSALATTAVPAAIASISTTPNDSPCNDGAQKTSAARSRENFSSSVTRPSHSNRGSPAVERVSSSVSGPSLPIHTRTGSECCCTAWMSTRRPLRSS